jgi:hypothetical protein
MKVDGRCFCGFITYTAEVDPDQAQVCHCADCQTLSSSAFRLTVPAALGSFHLLSGEPGIYVKVANSGNRRALAFCPRCGTSIYSAPAEPGGRDTYFGLRVGPLAQRAQLTPKSQCWTRSRRPWLDELHDLPGTEME